MHAERVHPEVVGELRVACGDVPGHTLVEAELTEQPERGGEVLLAVHALLGDIALLREQRRNVAARHLLSLFGGGVSHDCQITPVDTSPTIEPEEVVRSTRSAVIER